MVWREKSPDAGPVAFYWRCGIASALRFVSYLWSNLRSKKTGCRCYAHF